MVNYFRLIASLIICQLAGIIGSVFTVSSVSTWYVTLAKPVFNPPGWVFGPVWTVLYLLMGISLYLVWNNKNRTTKALVIFAVQLVLNSLWSILFFGLQSPLIAFIEIIVLWVAIVASIVQFYRISRPAAYLLIPYLLWVSFAAVLNLSIVLLN
ncbi:MAG: TspO/MBR family protein [Nanobdellota archaeon]